MTKNFAVITGTRAEYGLLYPLINEMRKCEDFQTSLLVTGTHLSHFHGYTINEIEKDEIPIEAAIDMELAGDTEDEVCHSIAVGLAKFSKHFNENSYDAIIVLGDRYELWSICMAAVIHRIPIIHIHGGESTIGLIDNVIRHSITKMASIHFPSIEVYKNRIMQMGENPAMVYTVGALAIDNIMNIKLLEKNQLLNTIGVDFNKEIALMTYHPVTLDDIEKAKVQTCNICDALLMTKMTVLITMPNSDMGGSIVYRTIKNYINEFPGKFILKKNLGRVNYLSAIKHSKLMIGNTSSAILESVPFKIPVIDIGDRQGGRYKAKNIIECGYDRREIEKAISKATSEEFREYLINLQNIYGDGTAAKKIVETIKGIDFKDKALLKKGFNDLSF